LQGKEIRFDKGTDIQKMRPEKDSMLCKEIGICFHALSSHNVRITERPAGRQGQDEWFDGQRRGRMRRDGRETKRDAAV
jgi:hypothetical protein